jgi:hypothetical protein
VGSSPAIGTIRKKRVYDGKMRRVLILLTNVRSRAQHQQTSLEAASRMTARIWLNFDFAAPEKAIAHRKTPAYDRAGGDLLCRLMVN